jgi:hypothetical protein
MTTYRIGFNENGNRVLRVQVAGERGFSIQTNGNLARTHRDGIGHWTSGEVVVYVREYGTERQREMLGVK